MKRNYYKTILTLFALTLIVAGGNIAASAQAHFRRQTDFNGDGKPDIVLADRRYTGSNNGSLVFHIGNTPNFNYRGVVWGTNADTPVAGDFDGDSRADFAVVRAAGNISVWYILNSAGTSYRSVQFGYAPSDNETLVPADYDGDGKTDVAVARRNTTNNTITYYWQRSLDGQLGGRTVSYDTNNAQCRATVPGDYNGDTFADFVVRCRQVSTSGQYFDITDNAANTKQRVFWGISNATTNPGGYFAEGDAFTPGDYDGDGKTDIAVARLVAVVGGNNAFNINWYVRMSSTGALMSRQYGGFVNNGAVEYFQDQPAPADYDGDGKTDIAIFRHTFNEATDRHATFFYWQNSLDGANRSLQFGEAGVNPPAGVPLTTFVSTSHYGNY